MKAAVGIAEQVNPDLIDINYGCPVKKITCKGAGAGILRDVPKMVRMTQRNSQIDDSARHCKNSTWLG